eukprot:GEMP01060205.1.p1 GENE.GEMP01060205.1~~GEMP01060205.1.p1  ORF type:complete len:341 (+),score=69.62 GEMP01060205.1:29-1051(+)
MCTQSSFFLFSRLGYFCVVVFRVSIFEKQMDNKRIAVFLIRAYIFLSNSSSLSEEERCRIEAANFLLANELVRQLQEKHKKHLLPLMIPAAQLPLLTTNIGVQDAQNAEGMRYQAEVHANVAALLGAFCFAALVSDGKTTVGIVTADNGTILDNDRFPLQLFLVSPFTMEIFDQIRIFLVASALVCLMLAFTKFFYLQLFLTGSHAREYFRAYAAPINVVCGTFHYGLLLWLCSVPLYVLKYFGFSLVFVASVLLLFFFLWSWIGGIIALTRMHLLLLHLEMGIYEEPAPTTLREFLHGMGNPDELLRQIVARRRELGTEWVEKAPFYRHMERPERNTMN